MGDPVERLKAHMIKFGQWSETRHQILVDEIAQQITNSWDEACTYGTMTTGPYLDKNELFEDVFRDMPPHLISQREQMRAMDQWDEEN